MQGQVSALQSDNTTLTSEVSALETKLSKVSYTDTGLNGLPPLKISGANLQIVSGSGSTFGDVHGLGNVIIGYDEEAGNQTGAHNLVLGFGETFTAWVGLIAGAGNMSTGNESAVFGNQNTASGVASTVTGGGSLYTACGNDSSVSGGEHNTASGFDSSILGGNGITVSSTDGTSP